MHSKGQQACILGRKTIQNILGILNTNTLSPLGRQVREAELCKIESIAKVTNDQ